MANNRESNDLFCALKKLDLDVDMLRVSEAITVLKSIQRHAKEATRALKELEWDKGVDYAKSKDLTVKAVVVCTSETDPFKVRNEVSKHIEKSNVYHWRFTNKELLKGIDRSKIVVIYDKPADIDTYYFGESIHLTFEQWKTLSQLFTKE